MIYLLSKILSLVLLIRDTEKISKFCHCNQILHHWEAHRSTKFELIWPKDVRGVAFLPEAGSRNRFSDSGHYNFWLVAHMEIILVFLESLWRELFKNVYFYPPLTYSFWVMVLSPKSCRDVQNHTESPLNYKFEFLTQLVNNFPPINESYLKLSYTVQSNLIYMIDLIHIHYSPTLLYNSGGPSYLYRDSS